MKKTNQIITTTALCIAFLFATSIAFAKEIKGNGKLITKTIEISEFSEIAISTYVVVNYSQKINPGTLEFTIDNNLWEYYDICAINNKLYIQLKAQYKNDIQLTPTKSSITVSSEQLEKISIAGKSEVNFCTHFTSKELKIALAGRSKIIADEYPVEIERLKADISGSGIAKISGDIESAEINIAGGGSVQFRGVIRQAKMCVAGSGKVKALGCEIKTLNASIAGNGHITAKVADTLAASVAGRGRVEFKGNPKIQTSITGSGKVKKL